MKVFSRSLALTIGMLVSVAGPAAFPAGAAATISPTVTVNESAGNIAGKTGSVGIAIGFNQSVGDAVRDVSILLPPGLLMNEETDSGACLVATGPAPACQIGSGTAGIAGATVPMSVYLVHPPASADLAGVELVAGTFAATGGVTFRSSSDSDLPPLFHVGTNIAFTGLPASPIDSLNMTLTGLTLPSSCQPSAISVTADSDRPLSIPSTVTAQYTATDCAALSFQPSATEHIARKRGSRFGTFTVGLTDPPVDSTIQSATVSFPQNLSLNPAMKPCLNGETCTVGTATATSPILPASQLTGTITLSGTSRQPVIGITFPPPLNLRLLSNFGSSLLGSPELKLPALPDVPLTTLTLSFTGTSAGPMFVVECYKNMFTATFAPWSGAASLASNGAVTKTGCSSPAHKAHATVTASLSGLTARTPRLSLTTATPTGAPGIKSLTIGLPSGLTFVAGDISKRTLSLSGATLARTRVRRGALLVTLTRPTPKSSLSVSGALLAESRSFRRGISAAHHVGTSHLTVRVTDARGHRRTLTVALKLG